MHQLFTIFINSVVRLAKILKGANEEQSFMDNFLVDRNIVYVMYVDIRTSMSKWETASDALAR